MNDMYYVLIQINVISKELFDLKQCFAVTSA